MVYYFVSERFDTERSYNVKRISRFFTSLDDAYDFYMDRVVVNNSRVDEGKPDSTQILSTEKPGNFPYIERVPASSGQLLVDETFDPGLAMLFM